MLAQHKSTLGCCCFETDPGIKPGIQHKPRNGRVFGSGLEKCRVLPTQGWSSRGFSTLYPSSIPGLDPAANTAEMLLQVGKGLKSWQREEDGDEESLF